MLAAETVSEWASAKDSPIHGRGLFARVRIAAGTYVIEYVGEKLSKQPAAEECERGNEYIFSLDDEFDLNGNVEWNPARLINHSCCPNCEAELIDQHVWIVALRDIEAGEEITFNYGYDLEDYREHACNCGSSNCVGFILAEELLPLLPR